MSVVNLKRAESRRNLASHSRSNRPAYSVPFNRPTLVGRELEYVQEAVSRGHLSGDGHFTRSCQSLLESRGICKKALLTHSCTAALEMAMILAGVQADDEVIMPSFTFVSTANAACLRGAKPVFVDIDPSALCLDPDAVEAAITEKTRAVITVHYAGFLHRLPELAEICNKHGVVLVEDAAQALGSTLNGVSAGRFGALSAFSFHETKNVISGEGGFLGINDADLFSRAEIVREKGTNRSSFIRGEVDKYTWVDVGSSFLPGELIAAFLFAQLEATDEINAHRHQAWSRYDEVLKPICVPEGVRTPEVPEGCVHNAHTYFLLMKSPEQRSQFIAHMKAAGVTAPFHYVPLHSSPAGERLGRTSGSMAETDRVASTLVRLPMFQIGEAEQEQVIDVAKAFFTRA